MSDPFYGEIRMAGFNYAPQDWAFCRGQLQSIAQNTALYSLLGTRFGGDARTTFGLPDLQGRVPLGPRRGPGLSDFRLGQDGGYAAVPLTESQMPSHNHALYTRMPGSGTTDSPTNNWLGFRGDFSSSKLFYKTPPGSGQAGMAANTLADTGSGQVHENRQPFLAVNFIICLYGTYPVRD